MGYHGLDRIEVPMAQAGDIVCITGIDALNISDTICDPQNEEAFTTAKCRWANRIDDFPRTTHHLRVKKVNLWRRAIFESA